MDKFAEELKKTGITLTERQREQFDRYYELLVERNKVMNLTGITDYDEVNLKHFTDSLTIVRLKDMSKISTLIDVGTGAGFPGIPIKIAFPHIKIVLLDSLNKRLKFLDDVIRELDLEEMIIKAKMGTEHRIEEAVVRLKPKPKKQNEEEND